MVCSEEVGEDPDFIQDFECYFKCNEEALEFVSSCEKKHGVTWWLIWQLCRKPSLKMLEACEVSGKNNGRFRSSECIFETRFQKITPGKKNNKWCNLIWALTSSTTQCCYIIALLSVYMCHFIIFLQQHYEEHSMLPNFFPFG